jgi:hypothetical protein
MVGLLKISLAKGKLEIPAKRIGLARYGKEDVRRLIFNFFMLMTIA